MSLYLLSNSFCDSILTMLRTISIALALCATALGATALTLPAVPSGAAQGATVLPVKAVVTKSDADIDAIRTFFFCQTSTCKKSLKGNSAAAAAAKPPRKRNSQ